MIRGVGWPAVVGISVVIALFDNAAILYSRCGRRMSRCVVLARTMVDVRRQCWRHGRLRSLCRGQAGRSSDGHSSAIDNSSRDVFPKRHRRN